MPFKISEFAEKMWILLSSAVILVYASLCILNYVETQFENIPRTNDLGLLNLLYLILITFTTVGYGDIVPNTQPGRMAIILLILVALLILPILIDDVIEAVKKQARGAGSLTIRRPFVILVGEFNDTHRILQVIKMLQRRDYLQKSLTDVILFARTPIPQDLKYAIKEFGLRSTIQYFLQNGTNQTELSRIKPSLAQFIFIISDYRIEDAYREDNHNLLLSMAFDTQAPHTPIYVETRLPNTSENLQDVVTGSLCLSTVKQIFLAYGTLYPGISTVLVNLLRGTTVRYDPGDPPWLDEYFDGSTMEIFKVPFGKSFVGKKFSKIALHFYKRNQVCLFACHIFVKDRGVHHVALNPKNYVISEGDHGFVIAESIEGLKEMMNECEQACEKGLKCLGETRKGLPPVLGEKSDRDGYLEANGLFLGYPKVKLGFIQ
jgi:Calcium-activated BK potassium channel alpha subunit/Ion channel